MLFTQADKVHQLVLRVRCVGVVHGRTAVAEAPFRAEQRFPGQPDKGFGDVQHAFTGEDVVIDIARFRLPAAIWRVVVVDFVTQIQPAAAQVVVKQTVAHVVAAGDGERNMLVQRVGADRVIAHRVEVTHLVTFTVALQIARFLAQAVKTLVLATAEIVRRAVAVGVQQIGAGRAIVRQFLPLTGFITVMPLQPQRLMDNHAQLFAGNHQSVVLLGQRPCRTGESAQIVALTTFPRHILIRRDAPGFIQRQLAFAFDQHSEQILFQHIQAQTVLAIDQQFQMVRGLFK
ncbi:hypothetical protein D3C71_1331300 [compost metagenome]